MKESAMLEIDKLIECYPALSVIKENLVIATNMIIETYNNGGQLLVCGNGGSASDSLHIVGELMKSFKLKRSIDDKTKERIMEMYPEDQDYLIHNLEGSLKAKSLVSETALMTAFSNDKSAELCFAQQVYGYGEPGDTLLAITTSGNSSNVIYAAKIAHVKGVKVISLTGDTGGKIKPLSDCLLNVPQSETYQIQEYHLPIYHALCLAVEKEFYE